MLINATTSAPLLRATSMVARSAMPNGETPEPTFSDETPDPLPTSSGPPRWLRGDHVQRQSLLRRSRCASHRLARREPHGNPLPDSTDAFNPLGSPVDIGMILTTSKLEALRLLVEPRANIEAMSSQLKN